jgi:hypothetical protein
MVGDIRNSTLSSFSDAAANASWLDVSGVANKGHSLDPGAPQFASLGLPAVDTGFNNSYDYPVMALAGIISEVNKRYNFTTAGCHGARIVLLAAWCVEVAENDIGHIPGTDLIWRFANKAISEIIDQRRRQHRRIPNRQTLAGKVAIFDIM